MRVQAIGDSRGPGACPPSTGARHGKRLGRRYQACAGRSTGEGWHEGLLGLGEGTIGGNPRWLLNLVYETVAHTSQRRMTFSPLGKGLGTVWRWRGREPPPLPPNMESPGLYIHLKFSKTGSLYLEEGLSRIVSVTHRASSNEFRLAYYYWG